MGVCSFFFVCRPRVTHFVGSPEVGDVHTLINPPRVMLKELVLEKDRTSDK